MASAPASADDVARSIVDAFLAYNDEFRSITRRARVTFETRNWQAARTDFDDPGNCLTAFKSNTWFGWIVLAAIIAG